MQFDFEAMLAPERYKLLLATVLPRPIAWVTTRDARGAVNAAPFSFFNVFGNDPATVGIGIGSKGPAEPKDTRANIRETEHFVVNLVPFSLAHEMRVTSIAFPRGVEEPGEAGSRLSHPTASACRALRRRLFRWNAPSCRRSRSAALASCSARS
jgi:flavin reductase (DIM6/NTAB) family NADH-FMN oxidoreductase RutF